MSLRRARSSEEGFTIVEVLVAVLCLALIVGSVSALFVSGNNQSLASQRQAALLSVAEQQIEQIRQAVKTSGFGALALSAVPTVNNGTVNATLPYGAGSVYTDPNHWLQSNGPCGSSGLEYAIEANYDTASQGTDMGNEPPFSGCDTGYEPVIVQPGGGSQPTGIVAPSQTVAVGTGQAPVDRYVTQTNVGCNATLGSGNCSGDARRVIVAVQFNGPAGRYNVGPNAPVYVASIFTNPTPSNAPNNSIGITLGLQIG